MMEPLTNIDKVIIKMWKYSDNTKPKWKFKSVSNYRTDLGYMGDPEPG